MGSPKKATFRLVVHTPAGSVVDCDVVAVNAEDRSGRFGLRPGVEPVVAAVVPTMLEYRDRSGESHLLAIHRGALQASRDGVRVAVRKAVPCSSLQAVRAELVESAQAERAGVRAARTAIRALYQRLYAALIEEART